MVALREEIPIIDSHIHMGSAAGVSQMAEIMEAAGFQAVCGAALTARGGSSTIQNDTCLLLKLLQPGKAYAFGGLHYNLPGIPRDAGWFWGDGNFPTTQELYSQIDDILNRHPRLKVVFAHFYFMSADVEGSRVFLDRWPNVSFDITPGVETYNKGSPLLYGRGQELGVFRAQADSRNVGGSFCYS